MNTPRAMGALPPPEHAWQDGLTVEQIDMVRDASRFLGLAPAAFLSSMQAILQVAKIQPGADGKAEVVVGGRVVGRQG